MQQTGLLNTKEINMSHKKDASKKPVKASYKEPIRPAKPHSNADKGKPQDQSKKKK